MIEFPKQIAEALVPHFEAADEFFERSIAGTPNDIRMIALKNATQFVYGRRAPRA